MEQMTGWTLDELVELVRAVLSVDYQGPPNGRVRDLPDRRAVRWYVTVGLVDRSSIPRGRIVLYGTRQLLQVVAIKRLQAAGRSLAQIQQELAGATDDTLRRIAQVPPDLLAGPPAPPATDSAATDHIEPASRARFWVDRATPASTGPAAPRRATPSTRPAGGTRPDGGATPDGAAAPVYGVALPGGAVLVLPAGVPALTQADLAAVRDAARPVVRTLAARGLIQLQTDQLQTDQLQTDQHQTDKDQTDRHQTDQFGGSQ